MSLATEDITVPDIDSWAPQQLQEQECLQQKQKQQPANLSCWTASFTNCLLSSSSNSVHGSCNGDGDGSFILLDNVMESGTIDSREKDEASGFCDNLSRELGVFLTKLNPARTIGDHRAANILNTLQSMGSQLLDPHDESTQHSTWENNGDRIRGDESIFVSREYRQKRSFAKKHPHLHKLILNTSRTLDWEFSGKKGRHNNINNNKNADSIRLDFSMTSVQLAMYPGDSKSGYRRHCDREESCKQEGIKATTRTTPVRNSSTKPERLITCIYYLTDDDWDASMDGGALRLFDSCDRDNDNDNGNGNSSTEIRKNQESPSYIDVVPFRDRMVVFRSDRVQHQVMPSHRRPRLAITIWFYGIVDKTHLKNECDISTSASSDSNTVGNIPPLPIHLVSSTNGLSPSIFVSIASYRDSETRPTIDAMYSTALKPRRIFTGIVAQLVEGEKDDEDIWTSITDTNVFRSNSEPWLPEKHQLRVMRLHARDATGPCYARGLCQSLYRGEDYVLQIDSHMRFRKNWDEYLIQTIEGLQDRRRRMSTGNEMEACHCDKIMLTTYPIGYTLPNNIPKETRGTYLVPWKFDDQGMLRQRGRLVRNKPTCPTSSRENQYHGKRSDTNTSNLSLAVVYPSSVSHAHRQYLYAGGFNFGPSIVVFDVPYDTMGLHHLFFGEELSMAVRLFTHGYDLYAPEETVCYHLWSRSHRPTNPVPVETTTVERNKCFRELSQAVVENQLLGDKAMVGTHFGLGETRTAVAFSDHLGVNFRNQNFVREGWDCGELNSEDFLENQDGNESLLPTDSMEVKLASLDHKAQSLIGMFLQGL